MAGGKGKSTGGKAGPKEVAGKSQKSHSAKAGLQVRFCALRDIFYGQLVYTDGFGARVCGRRVVEVSSMIP